MAHENKKIVSLSFLGTGQHREKHSHIITEFQKKISENPLVASRLFDGPGSSPLSPNSPDPIPGTYLYDPVTDTKKPIKDPARVTRQISDAMKQLTGSLIGDGVDLLLFEAILYLRQVFEDNEASPPETINLQGYSRGADSCLRMANIINQLYPNVKVNLFLIDHVPGPRRQDDVFSYTVPPNVERFESTYMLHEYRPGFEPQDPARYVFSAPAKTKTTTRLYTGKHGSGNRLYREGKLNHTSLLVHDDMARFCRETGSLSKVSHPIYSDQKANEPEKLSVQNLSDEKRFELLCGMQENEWRHAKGLPLNKRNILINRDNYVQHAELFINEEQRKLFKQLYPKIFRWFFEKNLGEALEKKIVVKELEKLQNDARVGHFFSLLETHCQFDSQNLKALPEPRGVLREEKSRQGEPLVHDRLSYLQYSLQAIANYYEYHQDKKSGLNDAMRDIIVSRVKKSQQMPEESAIQYLEITIGKVKEKLATHKDQGFISQQLHLLVPSVTQYSKEVLATLDKHLKDNTLLTENQRNLVQEALQTVHAILRDDSKNNQQQYLAIQKTVIGLNAQMKPEDEEQEVHNLFHQSFFALSKQPEKKVDMDSFRSTLNHLSHAQYGSINVSEVMIQKLAGYTRGNRFWRLVDNLFEFLNVPVPFRKPPTEKEEIATTLQTALQALKDKGKGNDIQAITKKLGTARAQLVNFYEKNTFKVDRLDKIINDTLSEISFGIFNSAEPINEQQSPHSEGEEGMLKSLSC